MPPMSEKRIYLREWRKSKGMVQTDVVERLLLLEDDQLPTTAASLSRIENGKQPYSQRILEALSDIYDCEPWELIGRHPEKEGDVVSIFGRLDDRQRRQALAVIEALAKEVG